MGRSHSTEPFEPPQRVTVKRCPWCGGALRYNARYPVRRLIPGEPLNASDEAIPESLRTRPAWACETPHCRFREPA